MDYQGMSEWTTKYAQYRNPMPNNDISSCLDGYWDRGTGILFTFPRKTARGNCWPRDLLPISKMRFTECVGKFLAQNVVTSVNIRVDAPSIFRPLTATLFSFP